MLSIRSLELHSLNTQLVILEVIKEINRGV
jgi:hypothetical protein